MNNDKMPSTEERRHRILFFDILRISAVILIVLHHLPGIPVNFLRPFLYDAGDVLNLFHITSGPVGVYILVFVSGAVSEYSYKNKDTLKRYWSFAIKRCERIYPAYWAALLVCSLIAPVFILDSRHIIFQILGFMPSPSYFAWWIGLFISLSLVFPIISKGMKNHPYKTLAICFIVSMVSRLIFYGVNTPIIGFPLPAIQVDRVIFICLLFEFALGTFIVRNNFYPKYLNKNIILLFAADLSYYVFLIHVPIREYLFGGYLKSFNMAFWEPWNILYYTIIVLLFAVFLMKFDEWIQKCIKKIDFLNGKTLNQI